jgi:recombination protein RecR
MLPQPIEKLAEMFRMFPGIGLRSSQKLALDLIEYPDDDYKNFVKSLQEARDKVKFCQNCGFFAEKKPKDDLTKASSLFESEIICEICGNLSRNPNQICLVEKPTEVMTLERSQIYRGHYHVIQNLISPLENVFPENTNIGDLFNRRIPKLLETKELQHKGKKVTSHKAPSSHPIELVLFFKAGFEGEATSAYIRELIVQKGLQEQVQITRLAQGLPLYYNPDSLDQATMAKALEDRRPV